MESRSRFEDRGVGALRVDLTLQFDVERGMVSVTINGVPVSPDTVPTPPLMTATSGSHMNMGEVAEAPRGLSERFSDFLTDRAACGKFLRIGGVALGTLALAVLTQVAIYEFGFGDRPDLLRRYGWWMVYLDINVTVLVAMSSYLRTYHFGSISHMLGMVMGMTAGMQVGTMIGAVLGATNGFFVGAMVGMLAGVAAGAYVGCRCRTTMAIVHGLMSGAMAGTMGAMLIVMMLRDRVLFFMPVFTFVNILIVVVGVYLFYEEGVATGRCGIRRKGGAWSQFAIGMSAIALLSTLMVAGPKGPMVWTGDAAAGRDAGSTGGGTGSM
ncbi:MAG: hypothetical protein U1E83_01475 [Methylotetracoccus sp.]